MDGRRMALIDWDTGRDATDIRFPNPVAVGVVLGEVMASTYSVGKTRYMDVG